MEQKDQIPFKGYQIMVMSFPHSGGWKFKTIIYRPDGQFSKDFLSPHAFNDEKEALEECLEYGKRVIDGEVPGYSISDI